MGANVSDVEDAKREQIKNFLEFLDSVAIYYRRRYIPGDAPLQMWVVLLLRLMPAAERFMAYLESR